MKIVFFGNPKFCLHPLLSLYNSQYDIVSVVTNTDRKSGRGLNLSSSFVKEKALELNIPIIETDNVHSDKLFNQLNDLNADLFVVVAFSILPDNIISIPEYGSINIHPSLLPKYRGSSPIQYALLNGDEETGVSIINLNRKIDSGSILGQKKFSIPSSANFGYMYEKLGILGSELLLKVIEDIKNDKSLTIVQDESQKTLAPKIKKEQYKIDWNQNSIQIYNQIRAFDPYPGAYALLNNKRIKLFGAQKEKIFNSPNLKVGQLLIEDDSLLIKSNTDFISISEVQLEGKKRVKSYDFIKTLENKEYILE
jgi:methionyl-tRNA formyltransferase